MPLVVDGSDRIVWVAGYGIDEAFRVTDPSQSVLLLRLRGLRPVARGFGRLCLNSTLKSLVFWVVLVVVGVIIWNFSTKFQQRPAAGQFQRVHVVG